MRLILYTQTYHARTPERQAELDHCLRRNLQHPAVDRVVVIREPDAPPLPGPARMPVQEIEEAERLTYARWMRLLQQERDAIGILINADIALGEGFEQMQQVLNTPESVMALSRYNPQGAGQPAKLNRFPHWTQDTWALRSDAPISDSLRYASSFPIGFPGCDNRIAYVLWSHGLAVKNPCYFVTTEHHQAEEARAYDKNVDRLYGGVSYVHPTLTLAEPSELEHTIWTRSRERCPGVLVNQQAVEQGVQQLLAKDKDGELAQQFLHQQKSSGQAWSCAPLGCARSANGSEVPVAELIKPDGWSLPLPEQRRLQGRQLRVPRQCGNGWRLTIQGQREGQNGWQELSLSDPAEAETMLGDPAKAKEKLGWTPTSTWRSWWLKWSRPTKKKRPKKRCCANRSLRWWAPWRSRPLIRLRSSHEGPYAPVQQPAGRESNQCNGLASTDSTSQWNREYLPFLSGKQDSSHQVLH